MFIELVDDLRCPRAHEETWLVAAAERTEGRDIIEGTLGCPICRAEYPIRAGVVWFAPAARAEAPATAAPAHHDDPELAMRLAALLDLSDAQGFALLAGTWASCAQPLRDLVPTHLVVLNPRPLGDVSVGISVLEIPGSIPLADATCRGVALDEAHADAAHLAAAVRVLRPGGRLVAPASTPTPSGVAELARDERVWVAEREARPPKLVALRPRGMS
ncbi:MAG: hypothetical protein ABR499_02980 [Gemmatimonadaceae bacterium]